MTHLLRTLIVLIAFCSKLAVAQTNVRAWNADGQVFVIWQISAQTTLSYSAYASGTQAVTNTKDAKLLGTVFQPEWSGKRLTLAQDGATWRIPDGKGGTYQLTASEGLFVFTPHESDAGLTHFYVTRNDDVTLGTENRTPQPVAVVYDPTNVPVRCHRQLQGTSAQGLPFEVYAMWVDGRDDPDDARPDIPVMANAAKNGAPHVFAVFAPQRGLPTQNPYPAVVCLHGGGQQGSYWTYAPNSGHYRNTGNVPTDGITIAFDDRIFLASNGQLNEDRPSNWFGWHTKMSATVAANAPSTVLVVPYTLRRLMWTIDWLIKSSTYSIDSNRIAVMGNSMGGTGTLLLTRWKPERFSAATAMVPPHYTPETGSRLFGTTALNLLTTERGQDGKPLRVNDFFDPTVRLSASSRDYCHTRIYRGRCDDAAEWGQQHIGLYNALNASGLGIHLYWDNRDHTASDWTTDDPKTPCPDIGQWVSPVRTERCAASYQSRLRSSQSYPGFFNDDQNIALAGVQPRIGNGDVSDGDAWGTWSGYYEWDVSTIVDSTSRWECTIYLVGTSKTSVDNYPGDSATCSVSIRKAQRFRPDNGTSLQWKLIDLATGQALQTGSTLPDPAGVVIVNGLRVHKDPRRTRLIVESGSTTEPTVFITSTAPLTGRIGTPYTYSVKAQNNVGEKITYALAASPAGMTIDTATGLIAWSAPTEGSHQVSVRASITSSGKPISATQTYTLVIEGTRPPLTITFTSNPPLTGIEGKPYSYQVRAVASDSSKTVLFRLAANAPSGMTLVTGTNVITWPSPVRGSYPITIIARVQGDTLLERQTYTLVISPDTTTSVNDDELGHSLRAYPNPASDRITIESASPLRNDAIAEILDARGQVVRRMTFQRGESRIAMDVQDLPSGSYAVRVTIGDTIVSLPVVVTR
jgi:pimeloyl-ACP methyl ester carboxylesterase